MVKSTILYSSLVCGATLFSRFSSIGADLASTISAITSSSSTSAPIEFERRNDLSDVIVIFRRDTPLHKREAHKAGLSDHIHEHIEDSAIQGYYGKFNESMIDRLKSDDHIEIVERDSYDYLNQFVYLQPNAPWGLARISHKSLAATNGASNGDYLFGATAGKGTVIYVIDSGVADKHREFTGRLRQGANMVTTEDSQDYVGHGTHVAGIAAGYSVGVAKFANIVSVKVIDKDRRASVSKIVQAISWVIDDHNKNPGQRSVINYSAVGSISQARAYAVQQAIASGVMVVTAAGNSNDDACRYGPADMSQTLPQGVITVGASNYTDMPAQFSNYGPCVDVFAPGVDIISASNELTPDNGGYRMMSGTSMASPYVAGLVSYFWSENLDRSMQDVKDLVIGSNQGSMQNLPGNTVNRLASNNV